MSAPPHSKSGIHAKLNITFIFYIKLYFRFKRKQLRNLFCERELVPFISDQSVSLHLGQLVGQGAAVHAEIVGELLSGKRNRELAAAILDGLFR